MSATLRLLLVLALLLGVAMPQRAAAQDDALEPRGVAAAAGAEV